MEYFISTLIGYGLGCLNPTYFISIAKHIDIHKKGTGNPGTTNAFINFGKGWGIFVLFIDILKAFVAVKVCQYMFPSVRLVGIVAGCSAVLGHIFPFYMKFKGGKGIASLFGFVLAVDWKLFVILLVIGGILMLIFNYRCSLSFSTAILFPILCAAKMNSFAAFLILVVCSVAISYKHIENIKKIKAGEEMPIRTFLCCHIFRRR